MTGSATGSSTFATWLHGRELQVGNFYLSISPNGRLADINVGKDRKALLVLQNVEEIEDTLRALEVLAGRRKP